MTKTNRQYVINLILCAFLTGSSVKEIKDSCATLILDALTSLTSSKDTIRSLLDALDVEVRKAKVSCLSAEELFKVVCLKFDEILDKEDK